MSNLLKSLYLGAGLMVAEGVANATSVLPTEATDAMATVTSAVGEMVTYLWSIGIAITIGFVGYKLFKKGTNKGTS